MCWSWNIYCSTSHYYSIWTCNMDKDIFLKSDPGLQNSVWSPILIAKADQVENPPEEKIRNTHNAQQHTKPEQYHWQFNKWRQDYHTKISLSRWWIVAVPHFPNPPVHKHFAQNNLYFVCIFFPIMYLFFSPMPRFVSVQSSQVTIWAINPHRKHT